MAAKNDRVGHSPSPCTCVIFGRQIAQKVPCASLQCTHCTAILLPLPLPLPTVQALVLGRLFSLVSFLLCSWVSGEPFKNLLRMD